VGDFPLPAGGSLVVAPAPGAGLGMWAGAPGAALDGEGGVVVAYRMRFGVRPEDGAATVVARSDDGAVWTTVATLDKARFGAMSMERPSLVRLDGGRWRLYVCSATPGSKHWWIDALDADDPVGFEDADAVTVFPGDERTAVKDPIVRRDGDRWHAWICCHPLDEPGAEDRFSTAYATSADGLAWDWHGAVFGPRPGRWDARGARLTAILPDGRAAYDGRATAEENWFERTGLARHAGDRFEALDGPPVSHVRYLDVLALPEGGYRIFYEAPLPDASHELRTEVRPAVAHYDGAVAALLTTVVGSYPQPDWLVDRERLGDRLPPRVRARELWRVAEPYLEEAQDDATRIAVQDLERAGVDVITDGEMRRESYSNRFATALEGVDLDRPGVALDRTGHENPVPRVVGPIRRRGPVETRDVAFLRGLTDRRIKITVPGPFTMTQQAQNDHYASDRDLALAYAEAVNEELHDLKAAGADVVQIDEPYLQARPEAAREYALEAIDRALAGIGGETVLHTCFGYAAIVHERPSGYPFLAELAECAATALSLEAAQPDLDPELLRPLAGKTIHLGVLDLGSEDVETAEDVAGRIRRALTVVPPERLVAAPDCGMKYLPRARAYAKLCAMVEGARLVEAELGA
jgi:5-methyltetrahydropteroyltriglutamate--homocysteine methyltransferase